MRRRLAALAVALVGAAIGLIGPAAPAQAATCSGYNCDYTDPAATGCSSGATDANSVWIKNNSGQYLALLKLRWSPTCKTNWGSIAKSTINNYSVGVSVARPSDGARTTWSGGTGSQYYSDQLYGNNIIICATGYIYDASGMYTGTVCA